MENSSDQISNRAQNLAAPTDDGFNFQEGLSDLRAKLPFSKVNETLALMSIRHF